jgi:cell division septation protein DedD
MKEKIFLRKTPKAPKGPSAPSPSSSSKVRTIFKFAIIGLVWIAIIPILWHHRNKGPEQKGPGSKNILLKEEIPRSTPSAEVAETKPQGTETLPAAVPPAAKPAVPQDSPVKPGAPTGGAESAAAKPVTAAPASQGKPVISGEPARPVAGTAPVGKPAAVAAPGAAPAGTAGEQAATAVQTGGAGSVPAGQPAPKPEPVKAAGKPPGASPETGRPVKPATPADKVSQQAAVKTAPTPAAGPSAAQPAARSDKPAEAGRDINWHYIVRLGAFPDAANAQSLQRKLQEKGYPVVLKTSQNLQKGKSYVVELKPVREADQAKAQMDKLQKEENLKPFLLKVSETR